MSGLGAMMSGGNPANGRQTNDFYRTPPEAVAALLGAEKFGPVIWEPACGDGRIVRPFEAAGYRVIASDIEPHDVGRKLDFFKVPSRQLNVDVVTNPPFDMAEEFIRHAWSFGPNKMAFLLKAHYWHAATRLGLWDAICPARVYPLAFRLDFMDLGRPTMECSWFVWERGYAGPAPLYMRPLANPLKVATIRRAAKRVAAIVSIISQR